MRLLYAIPDFDIDLGASAGELDIDAQGGFGLGVLVGWRFKQCAAIELELHFLPKIPLAITKPIEDDIGSAWVLNLIPALRVFAPADVLPERMSASALFGAGPLLTQGTMAIGKTNRSAMGATLALHAAATLSIRMAPDLFFSVDGGYVRAPSELRFDGVRLAPNLGLAAAGLTLLF
jgi:hypothetical protein